MSCSYIETWSMYYSKAVSDSQLPAKWAHVTLLSSSHDFWFDFRICLEISALTLRAPHEASEYLVQFFNTPLLALVDCRSGLVNCYPQEIKTIEYSPTPTSFSGLWTLSTQFKPDRVQQQPKHLFTHSGWLELILLWLELLVIIQTLSTIACAYRISSPLHLQLLQIPNISFYLKQQRFIWWTWILKFSSRTWKYSQIK